MKKKLREDRGWLREVMGYRLWIWVEERLIYGLTIEEMGDS
ncbi:hypothetical protein [Peijinzhouia sedimentorum]